MDAENPETYSKEYLRRLAQVGRTSVAGYCEKQINRLGAKSEAVEQMIDQLEKRIKDLAKDQHQADLDREYGRLESLQNEIDSARELIEEHFRDLAAIDVEKTVWQDHLDNTGTTD